MEVTSVSAGAGAQSAGALAKSLVKPAQVPFAELIDKVLSDTNAQQIQADQAVRQLATGQTDSIHEVVLAVTKADLAFRLVLEVRNRLIDAYQEVMRMQL